MKHSANDNAQRLWRKSNHVNIKSTETPLNGIVKVEEDNDDIPNHALLGSEAIVRVNWREDPSATPKRGRVRQLLNQLENGIPLHETLSKEKIPFYSSINTPPSP